MERRFMQQIEPLTAAQEAHAADEFMSEVRRELLVMGEESPSLPRVLAEARENIRCRPTIGEPVVLYSSPKGGMFPATRAATELAEEARHRDRLLQYGPDPVKLLADRLMSLGVPSAEATDLAERRVLRLDDGRVVARDQLGNVLWSPPAPDPKRERELTAEELEDVRSPKHALEFATRAILDERERPAPALESIDRGAVLRDRARGMI